MFLTNDYLISNEINRYLCTPNLYSFQFIASFPNQPVLKNELDGEFRYKEAVLLYFQKEK